MPETLEAAGKNIDLGRPKDAKLRHKGKKKKSQARRQGGGPAIKMNSSLTEKRVKKIPQKRGLSGEL